MKRKNEFVKNINLMISRLPLPAGPALDFGDIVADAGYEDEAEALDERGGPPFFVRGSILLSFLVAGVILLAGGAYYTLIRPLDFSGIPIPAPVKRAAVGPKERAAPVPAVRSPAPSRPMARMKDSTPPPTRPVSPGASRTLGRPGSPPPPSPAKKPSPGVPAAALAMTGTGDKERKSPVAGPPPGEVKMETPKPTKKASIAPGPAPGSAKPAPKTVKPAPEAVKSAPVTVKPAPAPPPESAKPVEKGLKVAMDKARPLAKEKARMTAGAAKKADRVVEKRRESSKPTRVARARTGRYSIQVGACKTAKCVEGLSRRLKKAGLEPMTAKSKSGKLTYVWTGTYPTWAAVIAELMNVKIRGFKDSYAVKQ